MVFIITKRTLCLFLTCALLSSCSGNSAQSQKQDILRSIYTKSVQQSLGADFLNTGKVIEKYTGDIPQEVRVCMRTIASSGSGKVTAHLDPDFPSARWSNNTGLDNARIATNLNPVFGYAVKNNQVNWAYIEKENNTLVNTFTFYVYPGDESFWYCYLTESDNFINDLVTNVSITEKSTSLLDDVKEIIGSYIADNTVLNTVSTQAKTDSIKRWNLLSEAEKADIAKSLGYNGEIKDGKFAGFLDTDLSGKKWTDWKNATMGVVPFSGREVLAFWNIMNTNDRTNIARELGYTGEIANGLFAAFLDEDASGKRWIAWKQKVGSISIGLLKPEANRRWQLLSQSQKNSIAQSLGYTNSENDGKFTLYLSEDVSGTRWNQWSDATLRVLPEVATDTVIASWSDLSQAQKETIIHSIGSSENSDDTKFFQWLDAHQKWNEWVARLLLQDNTSTLESIRASAHFFADNRWNLLSNDQRKNIAASLGYTGEIANGQFAAFLDQDIAGTRWNTWKAETLKEYPIPMSNTLPEWSAKTLEQKTKIVRTLGYSEDINSGNFDRWLDATQRWSIWAGQVSSTPSIDDIRVAAHRYSDNRWANLSSSQKEIVARTMGYNGETANGQFAAYLDSDTSGMKWAEWQNKVHNTIPDYAQVAATRWNYLSNAQRTHIANILDYNGVVEFGLFANYLDGFASSNSQKWQRWSEMVLNTTPDILSDNVKTRWNQLDSNNQNRIKTQIGFSSPGASSSDREFYLWLDATGSWGIFAKTVRSW